MNTLYALASQTSSTTGPNFDFLKPILPAVALVIFVGSFLSYVSQRRSGGYASSLTLVFGAAFSGAVFMLPSLMRTLASMFAGVSGDDSLSSPSSPPLSPSSSSPTSTPSPHHADHPTHVPWAWIGFGALALVAVILVAALA